MRSKTLSISRLCKKVSEVAGSVARVPDEEFLGSVMADEVITSVANGSETTFDVEGDTLQNPSAVLYGPHDLRIEDRPVPRPGPGEVLVEILAVGICGSDVHYYEHGRIGDFVVSEPMIIGHESAGMIRSVGVDVDPIRVGQLVALEPGVPCGSCRQCRRGSYNLCPGVVFFATPPVDGSISRYVTIAAGFAHPAPSGLTAEQAAMAEPVSVGVWAARRTGITGGDRVLVTGGGPIGLLAAQVARALGAADALVTDLSPFRLDRARQLGLRAASATDALGKEFDVCWSAPVRRRRWAPGWRHSHRAAEWRWSVWARTP